MNTREKQVLREVLSRMGDEAPSPVPLEELDMVEVHPLRRRSRPVTAFAFAAAFVAVFTVGGLIVSGNLASDQPSGAPPVASPNDPMVLLESPLAVRGTEGPEPLFDTSTLGQEARLVDPSDVADTVTRVEENLLSPEDDVIRYVVAGSTPSGASAGLVEASSGLHWCLWVVPPNATRPTCSGSRSSDTGPVLNFNPLPDVGWQQGTLAWGPLSPETSVVAITYGVEAYWQRPVGGIALFDIVNPGQQDVVLTTYDRNGEPLDTVTGPPIVEDQQ